MLARFGGEMATSFVTASFPLPALFPFTAKRAQNCVRGPFASGYSGAR